MEVWKMYKHAMIKHLKQYSRLRRAQPVIRMQVENARRKYDYTLSATGKEDEERKMLINRLERRYRSNEDYISEMDGCMQFLTDKEKTVLWHFYIERTYDYIEILNDKLGVERSQIYRIKDKALSHLSLIYFGVN